MAVGPTGSQTSSSYNASAGYRDGIYDPVVKIVYYIQDRNTQVAATILAGTTVTVTTTTGYVVDDFIAVVQDQSTNQVSAVGQVVSVTATTITVDSWTTNGTTPTIDGASDYAYELSDDTLSFGSLSTSVVSTAIIAWEATADVSQGFGVYVADDGAPGISGTATTLADVTDGTVAAGSSEYGGRSSDTTLATSTFDSQDTAFTTTPQLVASRADNSFSTRDFLTVKAAIDSSQTSGSYTGTLSLVLAGDY
ncbi:MAG: hypothetical protein NUV56_03750 [Candidatus Uhrbacteria bacterium]|nr:hypothetical protein [Candidatus Uhrbacteria bacterium]